MPSKEKQSVSKSVSIVKSYPALVKTIQGELRELDFIIKRRTAESYWQIGKYIHTHLLANKQRAEHGSAFYNRLAQDVDRDKSTLTRMVQFYRVYPILARGRELGWSHYRVLMAVKDKERRDRLEQEIIGKDWDAQQLQEYLRAKRERETAPRDKQSAPRLNVTRGHLHIYKTLVTDARGQGGEERLIDYGFGVRRPFPGREKRNFKDGDLIEYAKERYVKTAIEDKLRYTYQAYVERVVDGDTLLVLIEGGGGNLVQERLRLRGIDCPELKTEAGRKARRFVEQRLRGLPFVIIRTYREQVDIHARYITDVFYLADETDAAKVAAEGNFLNQELLDERLAAAYP